MMNPTAVSTAVSTGYSTLSGIVDDLFRRVQASRDRKFSKENLLRAYYMEVVSNLDFLATIDLTKVSGYKIASNEFRFILSNLQTTIAASIIFCETRAEKDAFSKLQKGGERDVLPESKNAIDRYKNILQAVSFTIDKIETLRKVNAVKQSLIHVYTNLRMVQRLEFIINRLEVIKAFLKTLPEITDIAR
jgi:hypothetical protein